MKRRAFLASTILAGAAATMPAFGKEDDRYFYEWQRFEMLNRSKREKLEAYWEKAAIPAFNRINIKPIGVFRPLYGSHGLYVYVLIPHKNIESFISAWDKLDQDEIYRQAAHEFIDTELADPLYYRFETSLLRAFSHLPKPEIPEHIKVKASRIYEVRTYESHNRQQAKLKIEMFNEGGEIALFRETGLHPVMFAETLAGSRMPNLTYMLCFENMEQRDRNWDRFRTNAGWQKMKDLPRYKDTVSSVTDIILTPAPCSQF